MNAKSTMRDTALVMMERKRYEEAERFGLVMDFEEFVAKYVGDDSKSVKERLEDLPCEPFIYVGDAYAQGDDDQKGRIVVEYDIAGDAKIVSTMDDYLNEARLRIEYDDRGFSEGGKRSLIACKA